MKLERMRTLAGSPPLWYTHPVGELGKTFIVELWRRKEAMPKPAAHALLWSPENQCYFLHTLNQPPLPLLPEDKEAWRAWLATHASFSLYVKLETSPLDKGPKSAVN